VVYADIHNTRLVPSQGSCERLVMGTVGFIPKKSNNNAGNDEATNFKSTPRPFILQDNYTETI